MQQGSRVHGWPCNWVVREHKCPLGFFTNFPQYKNANIANFILAVPLEMNKTNKVCKPLK